MLVTNDKQFHENVTMDCDLRVPMEDMEEEDVDDNFDCYFSDDDIPEDEVDKVTDT